MEQSGGGGHGVWHCECGVECEGCIECEVCGAPARPDQPAAATLAQPAASAADADSVLAVTKAFPLPPPPTAGPLASAAVAGAAATAVGASEQALLHVVSWNVAGWKTTIEQMRRLGGLRDWLARHRVDVLCLQETKLSARALEAEAEALGADLEV